MKKKHYESCHDCAIKLGAKMPKEGQMGITVWEGICPYCQTKDTLIPHRDYDWPKENVKAWFD
jgi:hypothetical protein